MVSLLPTIDSRLFHVKGGNKLLAQKLINATGANLHLGQKVTAIHRDKHGRYELYTRNAFTAVEVYPSSTPLMQLPIVWRALCCLALQMPC